jgi:hypothetical protein
VGLVTLPFRLPFLPVQGLMRIAELIRDEAEGEYYDPAAARRVLEEAADAHARGEISSDEVYEAEAEAIERVAGPGGAATTGASAADASGKTAGAPGVTEDDASGEE